MKLVFVSVLAVTLIGISTLILRTKLNTTPEPLVSPALLVSEILPSATPESALLYAAGGGVRVRNNLGFISEVSSSAKLLVGDTVQTDASSAASVQSEIGKDLLIGPDSVVTITSLGEVTRFSNAVGLFFARVKKILGLSQRYVIQTPTMLAAVRGTQFGIFSDKLHTLLVVREGTVTAKRIVDNFEITVPVNFVFDTKNATSSARTSSNVSSSESAWLTFADTYFSSSESALRGQALTNYFSTLRPKATPSPSSSPRASVTPTPAVKTITQMFGAGYQVGTVKTDVGSFSLSCIGENKNNVRVVTDSANESDCKNDCPAKPLAEYVSSHGGFAGLNGMYFCPPDYASCADKKNSYDTLFFNSRVKRYINSDNNVYSSIPFLVVFNDSSTRFVSHAQDWGRDTNIAAGTAGNPLLIRDRNNVASEYNLDDKQRNTKSNRGAFVQHGDILYLCIVKAATVPDSAAVYKTLNVDNAINIDGGGSSALYANGGYKFGPGRALPTAIIFVRK